MQAKILNLEKKMEKLQEKLKKIGPVMRGSIVELKMTYANKSCKCHMDKKYKHPALYFSVNINKKTKLIYLGKKKVNLAKKLNNNYNKMWAIIDEMTNTNLEILRFS